MSFVLLDVGGTFIKCRLSDSNKTSKINFPSFISSSTDKIKEIHPNELISKINNLMASVVNSNQKISGILISGQMHGWIITDGNYKPISNIVSWQDNRSLIYDNFFPDLVSKIRQEDIIKCGNEIKVGSPFVGISYELGSHNYGNYKILSLLSWIVSQITNDFVNLLNITDAAAFSFAEIANADWNKNIAKIGKIELDSLPMITNKIEIVGISKQFNCPVYTPIGDFQASIYGCKLKDDELSLNIATGGQVSRISSLIGDINIQTRPYFNDNYLLTKTHLPAGRHANYILSKFREGSLDSNWKFVNNINLMQVREALEQKRNNTDIHKLYMQDDLKQFEDLNILICYFYEIIQNYIDIVKKMNYQNKYKIVGSGGMISNSNFIRTMFEEVGNIQFDKIVLNQDASLEGLKLISLNI